MTSATNKEAGKKVEVLIPVLLAGGTEAQTLYLVRALRSAGYSVGICCYFEANGTVIQAFEREGARVSLLRLGSSGQAHRLRSLLRVGRAVFTHLRQTQPDVVHVQYLAPGLVSILAARAARVPTVLATVHQPGDPYGAMARLSLRLATGLSTAFFCVSRAVERSWFGDSALFDLSSVGKRRHFTLYDCVDVEQFAHGADQPGTQAIREELRLGDHPVVGVVGRLRREKGHAALLEALSLVVRSVPDLTLVVVGDGPERAHLEERARGLGLDGHIVWLGARRPEELPGLYGVMDVVAIPSQFEGFGLVAVEAMAAERAVVAFAVDGLAEVIEHGFTGYLVEPGKVEALAAALVHVLLHRDEAARMGSSGRQTVQDKFSYERYSEQVESAYRLFARDATRID
jgi:glycosyltransferase involved in cell wall biosynthesis